MRGRKKCKQFMIYKSLFHNNVRKEEEEKERGAFITIMSITTVKADKAARPIGRNLIMICPT